MKKEEAEKIRCVHCGQKNDSGRNDCEFCGSPLPDAEKDSSEQPILAPDPENYGNDIEVGISDQNDNDIKFSDGPFAEWTTEYYERPDISIYDETYSQEDKPSLAFFRFIGILLFATVIAFSWWYIEDRPSISIYDPIVKVHAIGTEEISQDEPSIYNAETVVRTYYDLLESGELDKAYSMLYYNLQRHPSFQRPTWDKYIQENEFKIMNTPEITHYKNMYNVTFIGKPGGGGSQYSNWTYCLATNGTDWLIIEIYAKYAECW